MTVVGMLSVMVLAAFLVEAAVEALFGWMVEHIHALRPYQWLLVYIAYAVGVVVAFRYEFDLIYLLAYEFGMNEFPHTELGIALTGLGIGRGSSWLHDLIDRFFLKKNA